MTAAGLNALRCAAAMAHAIPPVRLRLRDGDVVVADVQRSGPEIPGVRRLHPCELRRATGAALGIHRSARSSGVDRLPAIADLTVDVGVPTPDEFVGGGIIRVHSSRAVLHVFATLLSASHVRSAVEIADLRFEESLSETTGDVARIGFYRDVVTDVTLVHIRDEAPTRDRNTERARIAHEVLVACSRSEVESDIGLVLGAG